MPSSICCSLFAHSLRDFCICVFFSFCWKQFYTSSPYVASNKKDPTEEPNAAQSPSSCYRTLLPAWWDLLRCTSACSQSAFLPLLLSEIGDRSSTPTPPAIPIRSCQSTFIRESEYLQSAWKSRRRRTQDSTPRNCWQCYSVPHGEELKTTREAHYG